MAYLHCVPAVTVNDNFGSDPLKGIPGYPKGRQNTTLAIVDLGVQSSSSSSNGLKRVVSNQQQLPQTVPSTAQHAKAFPPSTPSSRVQFQHRRAQDTERWVATTTNRKSTKYIPAPEKKKDVDRLPRKSGSASLVEKVYKPTLPKYCFSASTYQNVLTDYAMSNSYGTSGDLSQLPPPRHTLMTRELPYVYRFKIQQGISSLNNMIPTQRIRATDHIW